MSLLLGPSDSPRSQTDLNLSTVAVSVRATKDPEVIGAMADIVQYITMLEKVMDKNHHLWLEFRS